MKIYNVNIRFALLILFLIFVLVILFFLAIGFIRPSVIVMTNENYTNVLKESHDDPYKFVNKKIIAEGYVFRAENFSKTQFVVARDMLVNQNESRIVGFLCEYQKASDFENNEWVSIEGILSVGDYYGAMPILQINKMEKITTPNDTFVLPPTNTRK